MRWSYRIGTLFGIPIRVHVTLLLFLGVAALMGGGLRGLVLMVAVFGSVVIHELGHALVARAKGLPIADISLYPFGGMARMLEPPRTTGDEIVVAAAGPLVSFMLGFGFWAIATATGSAEVLLLGKVNLILGAFNLLPALPMDGGRILRAVLARRLGHLRATRASARLARWIALALGLAGLAWSGWLLVIAIFLLLTSMAEEGVAQARQFMGDPGYQDTPADGGGFDPFSAPLGGRGPSPGTTRGATRVPGSDWEVLGDEPAPQPRSGRRVYTDRAGRRIVVDWTESR